MAVDSHALDGGLGAISPVLSLDALTLFAL